MKVVGSNLSTIYWMDVFRINLLVKFVKFVWKYEKHQKWPGMTQF